MPSPPSLSKLRNPSDHISSGRARERPPAVRHQPGRQHPAREGGGHDGLPGGRSQPLHHGAQETLPPRKHL